jgi:hypothetical protein
MVLSSAVVLGCVGVDRALFMLRIADEVHTRRVVKRRGHRLKDEKTKIQGKKSLGMEWVLRVRSAERRECRVWGMRKCETGYSGTSEQCVSICQEAGMVAPGVVVCLGTRGVVRCGCGSVATTD